MTIVQTPVGEASGLKLIRLIETRIQEILLKERNNTRKICLYNTGDYWTAFEHSAYQLQLLFPNSKTFVINHPNFPDSVVGLSVLEEQFKKVFQTQPLACNELNYKEITTSILNTQKYYTWHQQQVEKFSEVDGYVVSSEETYF